MIRATCSHPRRVLDDVDLPEHRRPTLEPRARRVGDVVEDVEWMAATGETFSNAAARLGYKTEKCLERTLHRAGRYDLVTRMRRNDAARELERWAA